MGRTGTGRAESPASVAEVTHAGHGLVTTAAEAGKAIKAMTENIKKHVGKLSRTSRKNDGIGPNTEIGSKLRLLFGQVQEEAIPERFLDLLEKLDAAEKKAKVDHTND